MPTAVGNNMMTDWPVSFKTLSQIHFARTEHKHYRVTYAYQIVGVNRDNERVDSEPYFVIKVAGAWCNTYEDVFTRTGGRRWATKAWGDGLTTEFPVYAGQPLLRAIELGYGHCTSYDLSLFNVPSCLHGYYHRLVHKPRPKLSADTQKRRLHQHMRSIKSRSEYRAAIERGLKAEQAIQFVRNLLGPELSPPVT
jgi:hypothetical protein